MEPLLNRIPVKNEAEIELMRISCRLLSEVHFELGQFIRPGITTADIDEYGEKLIRQKGCVPNFLNYEGYPASICVSVNEEVVHGIPSKDRILREGDIVSLDAGLIYRGFHSDAARTYGVGEISLEARQLINVTEQSFFEGIKKATDGAHLYEISNAIDDYVSQYGYGIVEALVGHGIGTKLHEDPQIPNFRQRRKGLKLRAGMTLAIEPMINLGTADVEWLDDDWTVVAADGLPSVHYENTILVTTGEPEISAAEDSASPDALDLSVPEGISVDDPVRMYHKYIARR